MTKRLVLLGAFAAALLAAAPAQAKEITKATIWGGSGSVTIDDRDDLGQLPLGAEYVTDPPVRTPWYAIDVTASADGNEHHVLLLYVASARRVAGVGEDGGLEWFQVTGRPAAMLDRVLDGVDPYPTPSGWPRWLKSPEQLAFLTDATVPPRDGSSIPAWTWALLAAGALFTAVAPAGLLVRRRRMHVPTRGAEAA